jgi:hypothetical protein
MNEEYSFDDPVEETLFAKIIWQWCDCGCNSFTPYDRDSVVAYREYCYYCMDKGIDRKRPCCKVWQGF